MKNTTRRVRSSNRHLAVYIVILWLIACRQFVFADQFINPWGQITNEHVSSPITWFLFESFRGERAQLDYHKLEVPIRVDEELTELSFQAKTVGIDLGVMNELKFVENELIDEIYKVWESDSFIGFTGDNGLIRTFEPFFVLEVRDGNLFLVTDFNSSNAAIDVAQTDFNPNTPPSNFGFGFRQFIQNFQCKSIYPFDTDGALTQYQITTRTSLLQEAFFIAINRPNLSLGLRTIDSCLNDHIDHYYLRFMIDESSKGAILKIKFYRFGKFVDRSNRTILIQAIGEDFLFPESTDTLDGITLEKPMNYAASTEMLEHLNRIRQTLEDEDGDGIVQLPVYVHESPFNPAQFFRGGILISNLKVAPAAPVSIVSLVGDKDNFQPGDLEDIPPQSSKVVNDILAPIEKDIGQGLGADLDQGGSDRPVGFTHFFTLPDQAQITSAKIKLRIKGNSSLVNNDFIIYDESEVKKVSVGFLPVIALRDLLEREPEEGEILELEIDLGKVPVRTVDTVGGPGGNWSPAPEEFRNLLPQLSDGQFNMVFSDDVTVDFSELEISHLFLSKP